MKIFRNTLLTATETILLGKRSPAKLPWYSICKRVGHELTLFVFLVYAFFQTSPWPVPSLSRKRLIISKSVNNASFSYESLYRYAVSGQAIRYVRISNQNQILLKAQKEGLATLTVFTSPTASEIRQVRVEKKKNFKRPDSLLQALNSLTQTEVIDAGDRFVLRGTVKELNEAAAIRRLLDHTRKI